MSKAKRGLQRVPKPESRAASDLHPLAQREARDEAALLVPIGRIQPDPDQPRRHIDETGIQELAASIREHGILQPLVLRQAGEQFHIIAGERRFRAAQAAGLSEVPARIYDNPDRAREAQLVENLQREDLNLLEEARALAELQTRLGTSVRGLEAATGKSKSYLFRRLKILEMPEDVQAMLAKEPRLLSRAEQVAGIADPSRRSAKIRELLGEEPAAKPRPSPSRGRPSSPLKLTKRKSGGFDLTVKYRPGRTNGEELLEELKRIVQELEREMTQK